MQWVQEPSQSNVDNLTVEGVKIVDIAGTKRGNI